MAAPTVGSVIRVTMPGDVTRTGKVLRIEDDGVIMQWIGYNLRPEWIPLHWL